ncbi:MAG: hypothetical protein IJ343_00600 [Clostridia bacterium]|nr:hypothetical protein [Clostridia bacterium]
MSDQVDCFLHYNMHPAEMVAIRRENPRPADDVKHRWEEKTNIQVKKTGKIQEMT